MQAHRAKTLSNRAFNESSKRDEKISSWMADKKIRDSDNKTEDIHCEEIDHNEVEIIQVRTT